MLVYTCQNATLLEITCHGSYMIVHFSKYSNLLQHEESLNREVSSCLPELGNSSLLEDSFVPVVCRKSPYNFLLSLLRMMTTFTKLHKGLVTQELVSR